MNLDPRSRWDRLVTPALVCVGLAAVFFVAASARHWNQSPIDAEDDPLFMVSACLALVMWAVMGLVIGLAQWQDWREERERRQREARRLFIDERAFSLPERDFSLGCENGRVGPWPQSGAGRVSGAPAIQSHREDAAQ